MSRAIKMVLAGLLVLTAGAGALYFAVRRSQENDSQKIAHFLSEMKDSLNTYAVDVDTTVAAGSSVLLSGTPVARITASARARARGDTANKVTYFARWTERSTSNTQADTTLVAVLETSSGADNAVKVRLVPRSEVSSVQRGYLLIGPPVRSVPLF